MATAEETKRIAATYKQAVTTAASRNGGLGGYKNTSFPRVLQPHRFQGIPAPQTSVSINAINARLAGSRPTETGV